MYLAIKTAVIGLGLSVLTIGVASAMIPKDSLEINRFADQGISSKLLSDIDKGWIPLGEPDIDRGHSDLGDLPEPITRRELGLVGKHLI